jgi:hypothetical protein
MATQWGSNSLAPGKTAGWFFVRSGTSGFLPVLSVVPLNPSFTDSTGFHFTEGFTTMSFPTQNQLGVSTIWSQRSNDGSQVTYFMLVMNFSQATINYAFLEADL